MTQWHYRSSGWWERKIDIKTIPGKRIRNEGIKLGWSISSELKSFTQNSVSLFFNRNTFMTCWKTEKLACKLSSTSIGSNHKLGIVEEDILVNNWYTYPIRDETSSLQWVL